MTCDISQHIQLSVDLCRLQGTIKALFCGKIESMNNMRGVTPLKKRKLADEVTHAIENIIIDNNLGPGDKMPSQAELSRQLQVGTRSIREAIRTLISRGMVESRQGKGVFVKENKMDYFMETLMGSFVFHFPEQKDLLIDLTKTRRIIESQSIYDVAVDPPKGFIPRFSSIIEELDEKAEQMNIDDYNLLDMELHRSIIDASNNKILISLYKHLTDLMVRCFSKTIQIRSGLETSINDHHKMLEAITARDGQKAKEIMEKHIGMTLDKILNYQ